VNQGDNTPMSWLFRLHETNPTAQAVAILSLVCVAGMALGSLRFRGIKLGTSGVLFVAILVGHFSKPVDHHTLEFVKELGLILFVFCIGLQLGPGFFSSLRESGLRMNALAAANVIGGAVVAAGLGWLMGIDGTAVLGIFSGATTNTPSLGAAQQALASNPDIDAQQAALPALAYAVTYPIGILGIIGTLLALKAVFRVDVSREVALRQSEARSRVNPLARRTMVVTNPNLDGVDVSRIPALGESRVVVSRIRGAGESQARAATGATTLRLGDAILVVGTSDGLDQFQKVIGESSDDNLTAEAGQVTSRRVVVTRTDALGKSMDEFVAALSSEVVITRVTRGEVELPATNDVCLKFGDTLLVVGTEEAIDTAAAQLGNSLHALNETQFIPFFAGISLGVALGTFPIPIPGLPQPLKLGLAAGPLIVAILVGRVGRIGRLVWHMPRNANMAFREFGIAIFFASVGLLAGPAFFSVVFGETGLLWLAAGFAVAVIPLSIVGVVARAAFSMSFVDLTGLLAGSMTDPPALAFAGNLCRSEAPAVAYATVYPLTMLLRIVSVQLLAIFLCG